MPLSSLKRAKLPHGDDRGAALSRSEKPERKPPPPPADSEDDEPTGDEEDEGEDNDDDEKGEDEDAEEQNDDREEEVKRATQISKHNPSDDPDPDPPTATSFKDLGVVPELCSACDRLGYTQPTPIQSKSIPLALSDRDLVALAETGSGKTVAFALPMLQALLDKQSPFFGLILSPTRELAHQIGQVFESLGSMIALRCAVIVGGLDMVPQSIALAKKPHVIVATPGRLLDHLEKTKGFSLRNLRYLVLDEADRLLDMDFGPVIEKILKVLPRDRRTFLFSATMSSKVESLQRASLRDPLRVQVSANKYQTVQGLLQNYIFIPHMHKDVYLIYLLNEFAGKAVILFTRTVIECQRIALLTRALGFGAIPLHGQLSQTARLGALNKFKAKSRDILVATDVAARGLDIPSVDLVVNYDVPQDSKTYIHRVGRTARAGKSGRAISIITQYDVEIFQRVEYALGKKLPEYPTSKEEVMVFKARVEEAQRHARRELREMMENGKGKGKGAGGFKGKKSGFGSGKRRWDNMDAEHD